LLASYEVQTIVRFVPWRGDAGRLGRVAWWGSALGDVATTVRSAHRSDIMREAALFNLAVALFDSIVDEASALSGQLAEALHPRKLERRLHCPADDAAKLSSQNATLRPIVGLFDSVMSSIGTRCQQQNVELHALQRMLERMFYSELGSGDDSYLAKRLPISFIGALVEEPSAGTLHYLFDEMADFFAKWDDWLDMAEDLTRLRGNCFLGMTRSWGLNRAGYAAQALARVAGGSACHRAVARTLAASMTAAISQSQGVSELCYKRVVALFAELIQ
jgi:hypothetical protein